MMQSANDNPSRTDLLLELIANEILRLRFQLHGDSDPVDLTELGEKRLDDEIISQRKKLGLYPSARESR
jgi:hypothetical protein